MLNIEKIKCNSYIYTNGSYVVIPDTKLFILRPDGSLVTCRKDLRNAGRITFLPDNRLLLCCKDVIHMINLSDGQDIWTAPFTKSYLHSSHFALSENQTFAYTFGENRCGPFIARINLHTLETDSFNLDRDVGATADILCDTEGIPCLLKTIGETIGGKQILQSGVRIHDFDGIAPYSTTVWKAKWSSECRSSICFLKDTDHVLTSDLKVLHIQTGALVDLLENKQSWVPPSSGQLTQWFDSTGQYLSILYQNANVVIDVQNQRVIAQYASSMRGALVDNQYWICDEGKIVRKPFPLYEDPLPLKNFYGMDWYYASRPERW